MKALPLSASERCPDENALVSFASGTLSGPKALGVETHLDGCDDCRALVAAVAAEHSCPDAASARTQLESGTATQSTLPGREEPPLSPGARLGRYVIGRVLGVGGMGVVYEAEDPRLGRRVALKLLRSAPGDAVGERQARLLREAQAMARLSHPNVLPVFDLGTEDGRGFLAMELVEGPTLAGWSRQAERPWREVLERFLEAGRGLAAAHRAGLVHRDFKPTNVLVGADGRARVTDFGLVRVDDDTGPSPTESSTASPEPTLTRAGAVPGTPAYMSPEQLEGRPVDARSDQFSFCVALHEALYGLRPFAVEAPREQRWTPRRPASGRHLPRPVKAALARGLALEPAARFPSMDALLDALGKPSARKGRGWALGLVVALAVAAISGQAWRMRTPHPIQQARKSLTLLVGDLRVLSLPGMTRLALGDPGILEVEAEGETAHLRALAPGKTTLLVWTQDDVPREYTIAVKPREP
jgi:eukaryotic-like serine/threonine-protein kinase